MKQSIAIFLATPFTSLALGLTLLLRPGLTGSAPEFSEGVLES